MPVFLFRTGEILRNRYLIINFGNFWAILNFLPFCISTKLWLPQKNWIEFLWFIFIFFRLRRETILYFSITWKWISSDSENNSMYMILLTTSTTSHSRLLELFLNTGIQRNPMPMALDESETRLYCYMWWASYCFVLSSCFSLSSIKRLS